MPIRKHTKPPPRFTFVTPEFEGNEMRWLKTHSDAARSHAAYWGGPAKRQWQANKESKIKKDNANAPDTNAEKRCHSHETNLEFRCFGARAVQRRRSAKLMNTKTMPLRGEYATPHHIDSNHWRYHPSLESEMKAMGSFSAGLSAFKFYSEDFTRQFFMVDNEECDMMFSSCLLLSYAHYMVLTGQGAIMTLLELKSQVMHHLSANMNLSDELLSPRCLIAILSLGAPIVCLVSRDLPRGLSIREYINVTLEEDYLRSEESVIVALNSLDEQTVHRQALRRLFLKLNNKFQDAESIALLQFISNYINISTAIEAADYLHTPLADVEKLFPETGLYQQFSIPQQWISPLTCQWVDKTPATYIEIEMLLLASLMHQWLATFLDKDNHVIPLTKELLQKRAALRHQIESFAPATKGPNLEAEAMYECCRRASFVLLAAEKRSIPIYVAAKHVESGPKLTKLLRMTDLSNLWGNHKGLLFWVTATCQFATAGQFFPLLCATLLARLVQELSMSTAHAEEAINSLKRLKQFESSCCYPESSNQEITMASSLLGE